MREREALRLALDALEEPKEHIAKHRRLEAINAIKEVLAQPEQKAVPWATREDYYRELNRSVEHIRKEMEIKSVTMRCKDFDLALPIINTHFGRVLVGQVFAPSQREWVGLTDEEYKKIRYGSDEIGELYVSYASYDEGDGYEEIEIHVDDFAKAIEAKLREKNGG